MGNKVSGFTVKKSLLSLAIVSALTLSACDGQDGRDGVDGAQGIQGSVGPVGPTGPQGEDGTGGSGGDGVATSGEYTTSGFEFPVGAIYVADVYEQLNGAQPAENDDITAAILTALDELGENATVVLPQGNYKVTSNISIQNSVGLTLTGYGINETQLDFLDSSDSDAFSIQGGHSLTVRDFSVYEAPKNAIKIQQMDGVHITYTGTIWPGELDDENGAYGLYPLESSNIIVENNLAYGSADAGVYVGQSENVIVRNNVARMNVAGIEIENTHNADVYNNLATENAGGLLVFDLVIPNGKAYGGNIRVFNNTVIENNTDNVVECAVGDTQCGGVGVVPPGSGALVYATSDVEIYNNYFRDNDTASIELTSYIIGDFDVANYPSKYGQVISQGWTPMIKNIYVHNNVIERSSIAPRGTFLMQAIAQDPLSTNMVNMVDGFTTDTFFAMNGSAENAVAPAILYDGIGELLSNAGELAPFQALVSDPAALADGINYGPYSEEDRICVVDNIDGNSVASARTYTSADIGIVFSPDPAVGIIDTDMDMIPDSPAPNFIREDLHDGSTTLECYKAERLPATKVTFKGKVYGCEGDDLAEPACSL